MEKDKLVEILNFFDPVDIEQTHEWTDIFDDYSFGSRMDIHTSEYVPCDDSQLDMAIFGVCDFDEDTVDFSSANKVRKCLYSLSQPFLNTRIMDLGNLRTGKNANDSIFALQEICVLLFSQKIHAVIIGGTQTFTIGQVKAFRDIESDINMVIIDSRIDYGHSNGIVGWNSFLNNIIEKEAASLYNISMVGFQSYFVDKWQIDSFEENNFELYRLGQVRENIAEMEPIMRDADIVSFDISAIRLCDAPGQLGNSPNGLYAEEACVLSRYAGISDRCRSFAVYGYNNSYDKRDQTAMEVAQILWYHIEGFEQRKNDYPQVSLDNYTKMYVSIDEIENPIVFYNSEKSQRWWVEVSNMEKDPDKNIKVVISCSESDYYKACNNEIPERWWTNFKKLR